MNTHQFHIFDDEWDEVACGFATLNAATQSALGLLADRKRGESLLVASTTGPFTEITPLAVHVKLTRLHDYGDRPPALEAA